MTLNGGRHLPHIFRLARPHISSDCTRAIRSNRIPRKFLTLIEAHCVLFTSRWPRVPNNLEVFMNSSKLLRIEFLPTFSLDCIRTNTQIYTHMHATCSFFCDQHQDENEKRKDFFIFRRKQGLPEVKRDANPSNQDLKVSIKSIRDESWRRRHAQRPTSSVLKLRLAYEVVRGYLACRVLVLFSFSSPTCLSSYCCSISFLPLPSHPRCCFSMG